MTHHSRRTLLTGLAALTLVPAARAQSPLDLTAFGLTPDLGTDQTTALQAALDAAAKTGQTLSLPPGTIRVRDLTLPPAIRIEGIPGRSILAASGDGIIASAANADGLAITGVSFDGGATGAPDRALLEITASASVTLDNCRFTGGQATGLATSGSAITITNCRFSGHPDAAIHALDSLGLFITSNTIAKCGNAGIRIWRSEPGMDGSIISANRIDTIDWRGGGNGQNGNGINIFKADAVIVADNHIANCAFSAIRLNATNNSQVSGNICLASGEVAIFSEFGFSGSLIANNIVDGAAGGISMTNFNEGGQLAVCSGNIVRNIAPRSLVNPDTTPFGIAAEADAAITGNTISKVPGSAISAGYGPYLRNVLVANNVLTDILVGITVSLAPDAGSAQISNNLIANADRPLIGMAWSDLIEADLIANAGKYPQLSIAGNTVSRS